ncbi:hypothetical protein FA10DRAFT_300386 [Acaromyces ingoldii]|uniref:MICOS complex subunit MIC60 n=1 Tax=Acaromyces ingoldii TaxID=215250 RepID=A0A316YT11_9BASI|nr:hypothetical protein FA10DRAFT_300386 [Acaromyces ingoldii]PWN91808.1 hypothetical protein FA10DRAFT_300386 [Acaromyces ingoldii]
MNRLPAAALAPSRRAAGLSSRPLVATARAQGLQARTFASEAEPTSRSPFRRFLVLTTLTASLFYGGSAYYAQQNERYADLFSEYVPGGERLLDFIDGGGANQASGYSQRVFETATSGYQRVSEAVSRVSGQVQDKAETLGGEAQEARKTAGERLEQSSRQAKETTLRVGTKTKETAEQAKEQGEGVAKDLEKKAEDLVGKVKKSISEAEEKLKGQAASATKTPQGAPYGKPLPLQHEAPAGFVAGSSRERGLHPENAPNARLRDDPEIPLLPKLAPSISSLSGSEPMVAHLASTVDDLAAFLREAPNGGSKARGVLDEAKKELQNLLERLDAIKKQEAERLRKGLDSARSKFDADLKRANEEAAKQVDQVDAKWKKEQEALRKKEASEYEAKLKEELATQSEIINERLREEVVSQGIEMQRRWMKEIKARVEAERGGRLAKLDELASDLSELQKISLGNSKALEDNASTLAVSAAVRDLQSVALDEQDEQGVRAPFRKQLDSLKKALEKSGSREEDALLAKALDQLEASRPDEGVESFSTLYSWFTNKLRPAVQRVALVPDQAGIGSHLISATISPLLFAKKGFPEGDDVPAVLARAQWHLERRDLDGAARQLNQLHGWPKILAEDWLDAARRRLEAQQHLEVASAEAHFASLQVA